MRSVMASSQVVVSLQDSVTHIYASITAVVHLHGADCCQSLFEIDAP